MTVNAESFWVNKIEPDSNSVCFICGDQEEKGFSTASYVESFEAGECIVAMFSQGARVVHLSRGEHDLTRVIIGSCYEHRINLEWLRSLTRNNKMIITPELVQRAISFTTVEGKTFSQEELDMLKAHFGQLPMIQKILEDMKRDLNDDVMIDGMIDYVDGYSEVFRFILDRDETRRWIHDHPQVEQSI